jgi:hypothetical protein
MTGIIMNIDIKNKNRRVTDLIGPRALCSASLRNRTGGSSDFLSSFNELNIKKAIRLIIVKRRKYVVTNGMFIYDPYKTKKTRPTR